MPDPLPLALGVLLGALVGALLAALGAARRRDADAAASVARTTELAQLRERAHLLHEALTHAQADGRRLRDETAALGQRLAATEARLAEERRAAEEKLALLAEARDGLTERFRLLAADILEEKSRRFTALTQEQVGQLLEPLRTRLADFQQQVARTYATEAQERSALRGEVQKLYDLSRQMSTEARDLTLALRGDRKVQGDWGEILLERVLEATGLQRGVHYDVQVAMTDGDGAAQRPDVVVRLPGSRHLVIDAKVSLVAYEEAATGGDEAVRDAALARHVQSVRAHLRGLAEKRYDRLHGIDGLDFVVLFVPVEPAFLMAVNADRDLFMDGWQRNVLLTSPSTLLFVLRLVERLWRQEDQQRNAQAIADRGAQLYDKLAAFVTDLDQVGQRLEQAQTAYRAARGRLVDGRGNAIRQAEMLRELGVKPGKALPAELTDRARAADQPEPPALPAGEAAG